MASGTITWNEREWCEALATHFFPPAAAQQPVLFFVDDAAVRALYPGDEADAVESLAQSVRAGLSLWDSRGYFTTIEARARRWKREGAPGDPPFLHLLALCVVAASRMGTGSVAASNYRHHLCQLLDLDDGKMPPGFDGLYELWNRLTWWLDVFNGGRRGIATIAEGVHFTHIGYPISQTLFQGADRGKLDDFFRWFALRPGEEVDAEDLGAHFRLWAPNRGLSPGAKKMLDDAVFATTIGRIVDAYARTWDGASSKAGIVRTASLRVVLRPGPPARVDLMAHQPTQFPGQVQTTLAGRTVTATAEDGVYALVGDVTARMLTGGLTLGSAAANLVLHGSDVHVLGQDVELGWASVDAFRPGERHWILVSAAHVEEVLDQVRRYAQPGETNGAAPPTLKDWRIIRNVVFEGPAALSGVLKRFRPSHGHRFKLSGGLPLRAAKTYLAGGAPDLWLPQTGGDHSVSVLLNGKRLRISGEQTRLADIIPSDEAGAHRLEWQQTSRSFSTVQSSRRLPAAAEIPVHGLHLDDEGNVVKHDAPAPGNTADVAVVGAIVEGAAVPHRPAPVLLQRKAQRRWLLGTTPGEIVEVAAPAVPVWLTQAGLLDRLFEARAPFEVVWAVQQWSLAPTLRIRQVGAAGPSDGWEGTPEERSEWWRLLADAALSPADDDGLELLEEYRVLAGPPIGHNQAEVDA